jgi:hypothetical protein
MFTCRWTNLGRDELLLIRAATEFGTLATDAADEQAAVASLWRALDPGTHERSKRYVLSFKFYVRGHPSANLEPRT